MEGEIRAQAGEQPWVQRLNQSDRVDYEQVRAEEIEDWSSKTTELIGEQLGDGLDSEKVAELSRRIGTAIRDCFEQGMQFGMDIESKRKQAELDRLRSFQINSLGGRG